MKPQSIIGANRVSKCSQNKSQITIGRKNKNEKINKNLKISRFIVDLPTKKTITNKFQSLGILKIIEQIIIDQYHYCSALET